MNRYYSGKQFEDDLRESVARRLFEGRLAVAFLQRNASRACQLLDRIEALLEIAVAEATPMPVATAQLAASPTPTLTPTPTREPPAQP